MSGVLLDTHRWLWFASDPARLSPEARSLLVDPNTKPFLSVASIWVSRAA